MVNSGGYRNITLCTGCISSKAKGLSTGLTNSSRTSIFHSGLFKNSAAVECFRKDAENT
jgi:hypothetical protein